MTDDEFSSVANCQTVLFAELAPLAPSDGLSATEAHDPKRRRHGREAAGERLWVDPSRVRVGALNPRNVALLDRNALAELHSVIEAVGQRVPAIVRRIENDPDFDYELIAGARRHRVACDRRANGGDALLLVEVIEADDKTAVAIADAENRGRQGLTEYERALYVSHQLKAAYGGDRAALRKALGLSESRLSRLLALADWPQPLLDAFGDPRAVRQKDAIALQGLLRGPARRAVLDQAAVVAEEQAAREREGRQPLDAGEVRTRIVAAVGAEVGSRELRDAETGELCFTVRSTSRNGVTLFIPADPHKQVAILEAIRAAVLKERRR